RGQHSVIIFVLALICSRERQARAQQWLAGRSEALAQTQIGNGFVSPACLSWLRLLIAQEKSVGGDMQNARRPCSFEGCFGGLLLKQERSIRQDCFDRQRLSLGSR